jgi:hypothetical protein
MEAMLGMFWAVVVIDSLVKAELRLVWRLAEHVVHPSGIFSFVEACNLMHLAFAPV